MEKIKDKPSLEEMIIACGQIIIYKHPKKNTWDEQFNDLWVVGITDNMENYLCADDNFVDFYFSKGERGKTIEEAVTKLYLTLKS